MKIKQNKRAMRERVGLFQLLKQLIFQPPNRKAQKPSKDINIYIFFTLQ